MAGSVFFSVIIPTFNRRRMLLDCLGSLEQQTYPSNQFEVIVVDDGSNDGTTEALESFKTQSRMDVLYFSQNHCGPGAARNAAAERARGEILAFTEDDVRVDARWLEYAERRFLASGAGGIEGKTVLQNSALPLRMFESGTQLGFLPCNLFVRKEVFVQLQGYSPDFFYAKRNLYFREDADFGFRLLEKGCTVIVSEDIVVAHPHQFLSWRDCLRHASRYFFDPLLYKRHPRLYRQHIEVKRLGKLRIHRPFHLSCMAYVFSVVGLLFSFIPRFSILLYPMTALLVLSLIAVLLRYERASFPATANVMRILAFLVLPFYYSYWFLRGCFHFKSIGAIV